MRSTSSGVSSRRWRAASIIRWAMAAARPTSSAVPEIVSVSPRSVMRAPVTRDSSTRLPSLTPARVSGSAPSVERRSVTAPSVTPWRPSRRCEGRARSSGGTGDGAPSNSARAAVVFGNAITSRSDPAPASCIAIRSNPNAMPPCGGAPARSPSSRNPNRARRRRFVDAEQRKDLAPGAADRSRGCSRRPARCR